jgi:hypothetical protein
MTINTTTAEYSILENQIIFCKLLKDAHVDIQEVNENFEATMKLADGKPYAALLDARTDTTVTKEARELAMSPEYGKLLVAHAIVTHSLANRLIASFMIRFDKPRAPTKLFSNDSDALAWLKERLKEADLKEKKNSFS